MASTATDRLRLQKQATYDNPNSWGVELNQGALDMVDEAFGIVEVTVNGNVTLDVQNYITDESRALVIILNGTGGFEVTHPAVNKPYLVLNDCVANVTLKPNGGTGAIIRAGTGAWYGTNAAGTAGRVVDPTLDKIRAAAGAVNLNGQKLTNVADPSDPQDAVTKNYLETEVANNPDLATVAGIAGEVVTVAHIQDGSIAFDAVTDVAAIAGEVILVAGVDGAVAQLAAMFVGASATDPTTRLDGSALQAGDFYLNTSGTPTVRVYSGSNWIPIAAVTIASQGEAEAGSNNTNFMTPLRTSQAIAALGYNRVATVTKTDTFSLPTTSTWTDVTDLSVTITPTSAAARVMITANLSVSHGTAASQINLRIVRNGSPVFVGDAASSRLRTSAGTRVENQGAIYPVSIAFVDAPATASAVTYKVQMYVTAATGYLNRSGGDNDGANTPRAASSLTAMEVGP